MKINKYSV